MTNEQVWKLYQSGNDTTKSELKKMFPDAFLTKGRWYESKTGAIFCFTGRFGNGVAYGWNTLGSWSDKIGVHHGEIYKEADIKIYPLFKKEAAKRGFGNVGWCAQLIWNECTGCTFTINGGDTIFDNGKWLRDYKRPTGVWYKFTSGSLCFFDTETSCYGFDENGEWQWVLQVANLNTYTGCKLATKDEVNAALIKEAINRYTDKSFDCVHGYHKNIYFFGIDKFALDKEMNCMRVENMISVACIFENGKWAKVSKVEKPYNKWYTNNTDIIAYFTDSKAAFGFLKSTDGTWKWSDKLGFAEGCKGLHCENCEWYATNKAEVNTLLKEIYGK
jgi:hypothetical protein